MAYSAWAENVERLRKEVRAQSLDVLKSARLASMTTTRAALTLADLRELPRFDLVVFDEASQVGLAHALALMPLGRARVFAGDPEQLAPVVRSPSPYPQRWLARSPFALKPSSGPSVCLLDEQSRMAGPICRVVSELFYKGELRVAGDVAQDTEWHSQRQLVFGHIRASEHVSVQDVAESGTWSQHYQGPIRYASAEMIAELVGTALEQHRIEPTGVVVLTPFRAQRALLKQRLSARNIRKVKVSTVHRAQGSEAPVVIFDPVDGANHFLLSEDARRLINVALSRAQGKVILFLSDTDRKNPVFARIWNIVRLSTDQRPILPIDQLVLQPGFPRIALGWRVSIAEYVGEVSRVSSDEGEFYLINELTGKEHHFLVSYLRDKALAKGP